MLDAHNAFPAAAAAIGGTVLDGKGLQPTMTATTVRGGEVTDGPFAETKDLIAGWMMIDVDSYERAVELAAELSAAPGAGGAAIHEWLELRPLLNHTPCVAD
jgi:hypothetical protein